MVYACVQPAPRARAGQTPPHRWDSRANGGAGATGEGTRACRAGRLTTPQGPARGHSLQATLSSDSGSCPLLFFCSTPTPSIELLRPLSNFRSLLDYFLFCYLLLTFKKTTHIYVGIYVHIYTHTDILTWKEKRLQKRMCYPMSFS